MTSCLADMTDDCRCRSHAGGKQQGLAAALQRGYFFFDDLGCGVAGPAIKKFTFICRIKGEIVFSCLEHMKRCHEDRWDHRAQIFVIVISEVTQNHLIIRAILLHW